MRKILFAGLLTLLAVNVLANTYIDTSEDNWTYGRMHQWRVHTAISNISRVVAMKESVYALSNHSLLSVDKLSQEISYHNRLTGLNGASIDQMEYNATTDALLVSYQNGQLDIIDAEGDIHNVPDLYLKQMSYAKVVNHIYMHEQKAYLSMTFGIIVLDMQKREIQDTYFLGGEGMAVNVKSTTILGDSIYALSSNSLYVAPMQSNLMDYASWQASPLPTGTDAKDLCVYDDHLYMVRDSTLWVNSDSKWQVCKTSFFVEGICPTDNELFILPKDMKGVSLLGTDSLIWQELNSFIYDVEQDGNDYWLATSTMGMYSTQLGRSFYPEGPANNTAFRMRAYGDRLYVVPGGRWATENYRSGSIMIFEDDRWTNISSYMLNQSFGLRPHDLMNVAQDPNDKEHYFVTSYGNGVLEMNGKEGVALYTPDNSPLRSVVPNLPQRYTRTDGAIFDDQGYLWVLNTGAADGTKNVHVIDTKGESMKWHSFNLAYNGATVVLHTPGEIMIDNRNPQWKWIPLCRYNPGLILLDDRGTPTNHADDQVTYRTTWYDQNGVQIMPKEIHSLAQGLDGVIWVGTNEGLFLIPPSVDFATSDRCERVIIPRNDGTQLADYLLDKEKITSIVVDGANRKWIGTANAGVFLLSEDGLETIEHFTAENSPLLSNTILSIAILETTGEVFIGTGEGLMSYMSDALPAEDDFTHIYAYPNPVHPNYKGEVVIKGLMADTQVRILDANGNLVKVLTGLGGEVIWDATNTAGERVASGIYTAICNTADGKAHGHVKVMIMN